MIRFSKLLLFTIFLTVLTSCGNDDDATTPSVVELPGTGSFSIDRVNFRLAQGFFYPSTEDEAGLYYKIIILADGGYTANTTTRLISGVASAVLIKTHDTVNRDDLSGTYDITDGTPVAGQATAYYAINYDPVNQTVDDEEDIESGTLTIRLNDDGTYNVVLSNGRVDIVGQMFTVDYDGLIKEL